SPDKPANVQKDLLFCGAESKDIQALQDWVVESSAVPSTLQLGTVSTLGGLRRYLKWQEKSQPCLFLDIDLDFSHLFVLSANQVELARPIPIGLNSMYPALQQQLGLKDEESARKLFDANTFDFKEVADDLL